MIIAKKILPIVLMCALSFNFSASCEEQISSLICENEAGDAVIIFDENLDKNNVIKSSFVDRLKKHKRAILIGLGCVVVVSAGAIVYRGEISDFFQKHLIGQKTDKKEEETPKIGDNSGAADGASGDKGQPEQGADSENKPPVVEDLGKDNIPVDQEEQPVEQESGTPLIASDNIAHKSDFLDTEEIENVVSDFFHKDEEEVQKKHEEAVALSKRVEEQINELSKSLSTKKPVITPPNKHSGFSGAIPSLS